VEVEAGMKSTAFLVAGVLLIGLAALWFFSPVSDLMMPAPAPDGEFATRSVGGGAKSILNWAEFLFDGLNAAFGAVGLYFTFKGWRLRRADKQISEDGA